MLLGDRIMSGGHYDYFQFHISQIADTIERDIKNNNTEDEYGYSYNMSSDVIARMQELQTKLELVAALVRAADWLYSGDSGQESFCIEYDNIIKGE